MYSCQTKNKITLVLWILTLFWLQNGVLWFELDDEIYSSFQSIYNWSYKDEYLNTPYNSVYPKDPFWEALKDAEDMSNQLKIAWIEYIENELASNNCSLSQKKIWAILYYFVPEFRAEIARNLKKEIGDASSKKYILDENKVLDYCADFYVCIKSDVDKKTWEQIDYSKLDYSECNEKKDKYDKCLSNCKGDSNTQCENKCNGSGKDYAKCQSECRNESYKKCETECRSKSGYGKCRESVQKKELKAVITSNTPANIKTNCQEFFQINYKKWQEAEQRVQKVQTSQLWSDKYWNSTTDDSPYDIMTDLWTVWKLLYQEAEQPITPVIYHLPMFSNSEAALSKHKDSGSSYENPWRRWSSGWWSNGWNSWWNSGWWSNNGWNSWWSSGGGDSSNPLPLPLPKRWEWFSMEWGYDDLIEWLWAYSVGKNSMYYWSLCDDNNDIEQWNEEPEWEDEDKGIKVKDISKIWRDVSKLWDPELEELKNYMLNAVDKYASLPDEKIAEMNEKAGDTGKYVEDTTPSQLEETANKIKNCWQSCKWLRLDQEASCMLMCACWEIKSPIFNPEKTPWLWPIFMIRFCTVPATDTRFALWWRKIISIEEWVKEIYGVVDKLSREWRLGIWTQQYNFLDSTTKKMKVVDSVAFSIDVEFVDTTNKQPKHSEQYQKKEITNSNKMWQRVYHISNDLEDPVLKNTYRLIWYEWEVVEDFTVKWNNEKTRNTLNELNKQPAPVVSPESDSHSSRYSDFSQKMDRWFDQQWNLWQESLWYINELHRYATALDQKPKI